MTREERHDFSQKMKQLKSIRKDLYTTWQLRGMKLVHDPNTWDDVYNLMSLLKQHPEVNDIESGSGRYYNYLDSDGDSLPYRDYEINIITNYGNMQGYIRCCAAGTHDDPFSSYDMILHINDPHIDSMNEGFVHKMDDLHIKKFVKELIKSKSFNDVKTVVKKYVKEGVIVGSLLTATFMNIALTPAQKQELTNDSINYSIELDKYSKYMVDDEYEEPSVIKYVMEPEWSLICSNVETTVYHADEKQCNDDIAHTASMFELDLTDVESHKIIAMERSMMKKYHLNYGDLVKIEGTKGYDDVYQIQDTMNKRFAGKNKIDILINKDSDLGAWKNVKIYRLMNPDECYEDLKEDMLDALNQETIDKKQSKS